MLDVTLKIFVVKSNKLLSINLLYMSISNSLRREKLY